MTVINKETGLCSQQNGSGAKMHQISGEIEGYEDTHDAFIHQFCSDDMTRNSFHEEGLCLDLFS
jgi:hypothetical protein